MTAKARVWHHDLDVIGLGFRVKKDTRTVLAQMIQTKGSIPGMRLVREPDNQYDSNAIAVYLPQRLMKGMQIGYLRRTTAELLAPKLDARNLVVMRATLLTLRVEDDFKEGSMDVTFKDSVTNP